MRQAHLIERDSSETRPIPRHHAVASREREPSMASLGRPSPTVPRLGASCVPDGQPRKINKQPPLFFPPSPHGGAKQKWAHDRMAACIANQRWHWSRPQGVRMAGGTACLAVMTAVLRGCVDKTRLKGVLPWPHFRKCLVTPEDAHANNQQRHGHKSRALCQRKECSKKNSRWQLAPTVFDQHQPPGR